jgi:hypothetical protein
LYQHFPVGAGLGHQLRQPVLIPALAQAGQFEEQHLKGGLKMIRRGWMLATMVCLVAAFAIAAT